MPCFIAKEFMQEKKYREIVRQKLDQVDELFPQKRIAKSKERLTRLWNGDAPLDRLPFTYSPVVASYWSISPKEERLLMYLDEFILRGQIEDDFIPSYFPGCHQGGMATLFGAEAIEVDNLGELDTTCIRLLPEVDDAKNLEPPHFHGNTIPERWLEEAAWCIDVTDGRLPVHIVDCFGPMEIAAKLWGFENLYLAANEQPELYDKTMSYATDAYIMFIEAQRKNAGDLLIETSLNAHDWAPVGKTISLGMDSMVMISEPFFEAFCSPYLERIVDKFAPLTIHSCGWPKHLIKFLCDSPLINGVHMGQMTLAEMVDAGGDAGVLYIPAGVDVHNLAEHMKLVREHNLRTCLTIGGLWKNPMNEWSHKDVLKMRRTHEDLVIPLMSGKYS